MQDLENKYNHKKKEFEECNVELEVLHYPISTLVTNGPPFQKIKKNLKELQTKEKELTERRDRCGDAAKKLRTGLRIFKVRDTLLKMGDEGDQARREILEAERLHFTKDITAEKKSLKIFLAEQRVRVPNLSLPLLYLFAIFLEPSFILSATAECYIISAGSNRRYIRHRRLQGGMRASAGHHTRPLRDGRCLEGLRVDERARATSQARDITQALPVIRGRCAAAA